MGFRGRIRWLIICARCTRRRFLRGRLGGGRREEVVLEVCFGRLLGVFGRSCGGGWVLVRVLEIAIEGFILDVIPLIDV